MPQINTPITNLLNIDIPLIQAPMGFGGRGELSSAVARAGAFGFIASEFRSSEDLKKDFALLRRDLDVKPGDPVPIGVAFIGWILDITETSDDPRIPAILEEKPAAVWFAFGTDLGKYVAQVREYDASREHKTLIFVMVGSVEDAIRAANEWKVDVIVAQGIEAGGHGSSEAPPLLTLLEGIVRVLPSGPPIVATGGIATGSQAAAVLTAGAAGVALGTRFLFTHESVLTPDQRNAIVNAGLINSTIRTLAFDEVGRTNGWPPKHDGRAIRNDIIKDLEDGLDLGTRMKKYDESKASGDMSRLITWAGVGVGLTDSITSAEDVVRELQDEIIRALMKASSLLS
ncbi:hypothetical protein V5O48_002516 [Marasmius crinis-equi]|uniref:Nitronate monooxygenase n=1 Tax=Marasmius crinis-equi TaxID=585013 RepID=A0ABR3FVG4_9AGAR